jgi:hypothetical protein
MGKAGAMIKSFTIKNFRSFQDASVGDCRRINVIVGDNGSGKTAMLEALFLAAGVSPEIAVRTRGWRGHDGEMGGTHEDIHDALWSDLFHKFQATKPAYVKLEGSGDENRSVTVTLNKRGAVKIVPSGRERPGRAPKVIPVSSDTPIQFRWSIRGYGDFSVEPKFQESKLVFPSIPVEPIRASFLAANRTAPSRETVNRFSALSQSFHEDEFIERFNRVYPTIRHLSIETSAGLPMIFASVEGLPKKIPLSLASGGMNKLVSIMLAMTNQSGGIVLVDEIENGFFHTHFQKVWEAILDFSLFYDCQVFASTHSLECLKAVAKLAERNPAEFSLIRAVQSGDGTLVRRFDGERFAHAVMDSVEVR